jgi:hypothetical protein
MSEAGRQLALIGADAAAAHADRVHGSWSDVAWDFLVSFGKARSGQSFFAEDVRAHAELRKAVPMPPDSRAWGSIFMRASKARLIQRVGYAPQSSPNCHGSPKAVWIWVG